MNSEKSKIILAPLKHAYKILWIGIPLCLLTPLIFTLKLNWLDFTGTGNIGDTIGGITAPFINIIGAILVFMALKAQIQANVLIQDQINTQDVLNKQENESKQLNQFYNSLKDSIDGFTFSTLDTWSIGDKENDNIVLVGSEALYKFFHDFYCDFHIEEQEMTSNPKITEVISMLEICDYLLEKISNSVIPDRETLWTLATHQFSYRIFPKLSMEYPHNLNNHFCESCDKDHGLPPKIVDRIKSIKDKIEKGI